MENPAYFYIYEKRRIYMDRNLDGVYFRVKRTDKWENVCFSDLTEAQMQEVMLNRDEVWLKSLLAHLNESLKNIGDFLGKDFNVVSKETFESLSFSTSLLTKMCLLTGELIKTIGTTYDIVCK